MGDNEVTEACDEYNIKMIFTEKDFSYIKILSSHRPIVLNPVCVMYPRPHKEMGYLNKYHKDFVLSLL